ncbi:amidohydrolase family protein [Candidatus Bathyarchaeota archaeon]|nr:amidohydrolase family protein [Candidatus Bathyarchaeota archaeon]
MNQEGPLDNLLRLTEGITLIKLKSVDLSLQEETRVNRRRDLPKVDYHCHISITEYSDPSNPTVISVNLDEFRADLNEAGIDKAVILSDKRTSPEEVSEFCRQSPREFIGFGYVNPIKNGAYEEVLRQRNELDLFGLKLYPCSDGYSPDDTHAFKVYEAASSIGMPVMFHQAGMPDAYDYMKHTNPAQIDIVADSFPELKIVLAHLGYPRVDETLYVARKHKNVWCDISWPYGDVNHPSFLYMLWKDLLTSLNLGIINKIIFGTDYPGVRQRPYVDMLMNINRYAPHNDLKIPMEKLSEMMDKNIQPLLP